LYRRAAAVSPEPARIPRLSREEEIAAGARPFGAEGAWRAQEALCLRCPGCSEPEVSPRCRVGCEAVWRMLLGLPERSS